MGHVAPLLAGVTKLGFARMFLSGVKKCRRSGLGLLASLVLAGFAGVFAASPAEARHHHYHHHLRHFAGGGYRPPFSAIVVDANAGKVLYAVDAKESRHPASLTKVMTLYLLFEQLERGAITMDTRIPVSAHAASMAPTKLGLEPGETIAVSNAIKAVVTQSANDMAVAIAEAIGGSEDAFAEMMTRKAHSLGMNDTHFVNASGLPDDDQITTAYDLSVLARAIQERFPRYYPVFATRSFFYDGRAMHNHNHLLGRIEGLDGIKTGYTRASGFNLMTNVRRDGRQIVAVVMGGASAAGRDHIMANMIEDHFREASAGEHMAPVLADASPHAKPAVVADASVPSRPPMKPLTITAAIGGGEDAHLPTTIQAYTSTTTPSAPRWSVAGKLVQAAAERDEESEHKEPTTGAPGAKLFTDRLPARTPPTVTNSAGASATPAARTEPSKAILVRLDPDKPEPPNKEPRARTETDAGKAQAKAAATLADQAANGSNAAIGSKASPRSGWMIQLGAVPEENKASELIQRARSSGGHVLSKAESFTEKVTKDGATLFRARFAGFDEEAAQSACKVLKRSGFACFATRS
ncbi:MAG: D-alanyl-D-alanine carboxypeptidase [Hyphomicrobiales bacterium]|nr:D-alanyl-D-alanine carboxypeptidase [Hyphomicrobiales bacterium]